MAYFSELNSVAKNLNEKFFEGEMEVPSFEVNLKRKTFFHYDQKRNVLVVGKSLQDTDDNVIISEMIRQFILIYNHQKDICNYPQGEYHNTSFKEKALQIGFNVIKIEKKGWAGICLDEEGKDLENRKRLKLFFESFGKDYFKKFRNGIIEMSKNKTNKQFFIKYQCKCSPPHNSIRSGRRPSSKYKLNIKCLNCNSSFVCCEVVD